MQGKARLGNASVARPGKALLCKVRLGKAGKGKARRG
jgi:hypothetical protein